MSASLEKSSDEERGVASILKNWFLNSPLHGIRRIGFAESTSGRFFWSTIFIVFTILMCIFIYTIFMKFIDHPTKINLSLRHYHDSSFFPAITFCNLNPLRDDKFLNDDKYRERFADFVTEDEHQNRFMKYMGMILNKNLNSGQPAYVESGYKLNDLLIQCTFNGQECFRNLTSFFHPNYGNCYTFDNDHHVKPTLLNNTFYFWSIHDEDIKDGYKLFLELYLYQSEYIPYLDDRAAFRIFIHRKHEIPILSQHSLFLAPATFTKIIFSQRIISFAQQCRNDLTKDMKQIFRSNNVRYSQALCFKLCKFRFIEKQCGCTDQLLMVFFQFFSENHIIHTNTNNSCSKNNQCFANRHSFNSRKSCPECLPECELVQYKIQLSNADYPNSRSTFKVLDHIEKHLQNIGYSVDSSNKSICSNSRKEALLDNIVAVEISASPFATEVLTESSMYTWVDLISSIGGQTGLWIGVSLIGFVEIAELLFLLLRYLLQRIYQNILNHWEKLYQRSLAKTMSTRL